MDAPASLSLEPIGIVHSPLATKVQAARQPRAADGAPARIELLPGRNFEHALEDLAAWERIWVIFWFHRNRGWRPKVLPPRSTTGRKGVFATRSPHRPNPIGMSAVRLERIDGLNLYVLDSDMLDGTPVLDLKPYVAYADAHPQAGSGWLEAQSQRDGGCVDPIGEHTIEFEALASAQIAWVETHSGFALGERIRSVLALGPAPHPYRRIRRLDDCMQLSVQEWRVRFVVTGRRIRVLEVRSGFRASQLAEGEGSESVRVHKAFVVSWPALAHR